MRARASRLADKLILGAWVTTNVSQRISRLLLHLPLPLTFNLSQLASWPAKNPMLTEEPVYGLISDPFCGKIYVRYIRNWQQTVSRHDGRYFGDRTPGCGCRATVHF